MNSAQNAVVVRQRSGREVEGAEKSIPVLSSAFQCLCSSTVLIGFSELHLNALLSWQDH